MYRRFSERANCHILGGSYKEAGGVITEWHCNIRLDADSTLRFRKPLPKDHDAPFNVDMVHNFFIADTALVRRMGGWDENIAIVSEHPDFFMKAKMAGLNVLFDPRALIGHAPGPDKGSPAPYLKNRKRVRFRSVFLRKWGLTRMIHNSGRRYYQSGRKRSLRVAGRTAVGVVTTARSGSSCMGQVLETLGVPMGQSLLKPTGEMERVNPDGYFEDASLMRIARQFGLEDRPQPKSVKARLYDELDDYFHHLSCRHTVWGFKNPTLSEHLDEVNDMLLHRGIRRKWIWAYRDPEDCIKSFMEAGWGGGARKFAERNILPRLQAIESFAEKTPPGELLKVDFYKLLDDPEGEVGRVADFLGVDCPDTISRAVATIKPAAARSRTIQ